VPRPVTSLPRPTPAAAAAPRRRVLFALAGLHRVRRGAEVAFESIGAALASLPGWDVTLIGTGAPDPRRPYAFRSVPCVPRERFERFPSLPLLRTPYVYEELTYLPGLLRAYRPRDFDLTCTCAYPFTSWALRGLRLGGAAPAHVFVTQNGDWPVRARHREYRAFRCDGLVCTNPEYHARNRDRWHSTVIPNGVDERVFGPGPRARGALGLPEAAPVALMVSAAIPSKRVEEGIRAAARVPGLHLLVAGDGPLRARVDACGLELMGERFRRVSVAHADMPALYRTADVFLHMSVDEPFGNVYLEALATGLPVVAHDSPTSRWILEQQGILVNAKDEASVADALVRALAARAPEQVLARRALVERRFTWLRVAEQYARFFEDVLSATRS
jgi:glycosyltransferase involved in cell wall biosynthesis